MNTSEGLTGSPKYFEWIIGRHLFACIALSVMSIAIRAEELPTNTDLRAAYCIGVGTDIEPVAKESIAWAATQSPETAKIVRDFAGRQLNQLHRLRQYLVPRLFNLEISGIKIAQAQGLQDSKDASADALACLNVCPGINDVAKKCTEACTSKSEKITRIKICNDLSWLPY